MEPRVFRLGSRSGRLLLRPPGPCLRPRRQAHIVWHDHQDPDTFVPELGDAAYAIEGALDWEVDYAYSSGHDGWDATIAVDSRGNVHMIGIDPYNFLREEGIEHYFYDGEKWTVESIAPLPSPTNGAPA